MPIEIELPDGSIAEFPDGMPDTEIEAVIQRQFPKQPAPQPAQDKPVRATDNMGGLDRFRAGIGKGLTDVVDGIAQAAVDQFSRPIPALADVLADINPEAARQAEQTLLRPQQAMRERTAERRATDADLMDTGAGWVGGLAGSVAGTLPIGGFGMAARGVSAARAIGQNALAGAFQGSLMPVVNDEERLKNSALGAAFGGGLSAAGRGVMRAAEEVLPSNTLARVMNYFGNKANKTSYAADSEALAQRTGIDFTPAMVSGGRGQTALENMARQSVFSADTAFEADQRIAGQAIQYVNNVMDRISRDKLSPQGIGDGIQQAVRRGVEQIAESREQVASRQFGAIRKIVGDAPVVDYAATRKALQDILAEYGDVIGAESGKIRAQAQTMLDEIAQKGAGVSLDAARRSRGAYGAASRGSANIFQDINPAVDRRLAARMYGAISDDIEAAAGRLDEMAGFGQNMPVQAGTQAMRPSEMLRQANNDYRRHSQLLEAVKNSPLRRLLGDEFKVEDFMAVNTLPPEKVIQRIGAMEVSEVKMVRDFMEKNAPDTWQQYKRLLVDDALAAAETAPTSSGANHVPFNASGFMRALGGDKPKKVEQLRAIFNPAEMEEVMDAMQAARRLGDKFGANFSGTGPYAEVMQASRSFVDSIRSMSISGLAGATSPALGLQGVARMMLNSDGRKGLIELARLPQGSKRANDLAAYLASVAAVRTGGDNEPLEVDVVGGQSGAAPTQEEMELLRAQAAGRAGQAQ